MVVDWDPTQPMDELLDAPGVYAICYIFPNAGCLYIGCTTRSFAERLTAHYTDLERGKHKCRELQSCFDQSERQEIDFLILSVALGQASVEQEEARYMALVGIMQKNFRLLNNEADLAYHRARQIAPLLPAVVDWSADHEYRRCYDAWLSSELPLVAKRDTLFLRVGHFGFKDGDLRFS